MVDQAVRDNPAVTAAKIRDIWARATEGAAIERIADYANKHVGDCDGDRDRALREMSDEPGEVALACRCTVAQVHRWIDAQLGKVRS